MDRSEAFRNVARIVGRRTSSCRGQLQLAAGSVCGELGSNWCGEQRVILLRDGGRRDRIKGVQQIFRGAAQYR